MNSPDADSQLDSLFAAYHRACGEPEPSPNFMPYLWRKIEARQSVSFYLGRFAGRFVTAAMALTLVLALFVYMPKPQSAIVYRATYLDTLMASHDPDSGTVFGASHPDPVQDLDIERDIL